MSLVGLARAFMGGSPWALWPVCFACWWLGQSTGDTVPRRVHLETLDVLETEKRRSAELSDSMAAFRGKVEVERSRNASALQDLEVGFGLE